MKLPRRLDYACRVLLRLGRNPEQVARVEDLAAAEEISAHYLVQILKELASAGFVTSLRGRQGGYRLQKPIAEITLAQVVEAMEGQWLEVPHSEQGKESLQALWQQVSTEMTQVLENISLADWLPEEEVVADWVI